MRTSTIVIGGLSALLILFVAYAYWPVEGSISGFQCAMRAGHAVSLAEASEGPQTGFIRQLCPVGQRNIGEIPGAGSVCCKKSPKDAP